MGVCLIRGAALLAGGAAACAFGSECAGSAQIRPCSSSPTLSPSSLADPLPRLLPARHSRPTHAPSFPSASFPSALSPPVLSALSRPPTYPIHPLPPPTYPRCNHSLRLVWLRSACPHSYPFSHVRLNRVRCRLRAEADWPVWDPDFSTLAPLRSLGRLLRRAATHLLPRAYPPLPSVPSPPLRSGSIAQRARPCPFLPTVFLSVFPSGRPFRSHIPVEHSGRLFSSGFSSGLRARAGVLSGRGL